MDRSLPVADCLEGNVEVSGGHGDVLPEVGLLQELVLLARRLPQLRADVHHQVHVGDVLEHVQEQDQGLGAVRREGAGPVGLVDGNPPDLAEDCIDLPARLEADFPLMNSISSRLQKNNSKFRNKYFLLGMKNIFLAKQTLT